MKNETNKSDYMIQNFLMDSSFFNWIKKGDKKEGDKWDLWILEHPDKKEEFEEAIRILKTMDFKKEEILASDQAKLWLKVNSVLSQHENFKKSNRLKRKQIPLFALPKYIVRYAAVFLLVAAAALVYYNSIQYQTEVLSTGNGEVKSFVLADSSIVTLNANSSVRFSKNKEERREVWIEGEAFFEIRKKEDHSKFIVHSGDLDVEVLGTEFNVKNRRGSVSVVLTSGKVKINSVKDQQNLLEMKPGEMVSYQSSDHKYEVKNVKTELFTTWKTNTLIFDDVSLENLAIVIKDQFGKEVVFENPASASLRFTGSNPANDLELLVKTLEITFGVEIEEINDKVIIK